MLKISEYNQNYLLLHGLVLLNALAPSFVKLISVNALEIVILRTLIALGTLLFIIVIGRLRLKTSWPIFRRLFIMGMLTAVFLFLLNLSAKMANASVTLVGLATTPLWVALLMPLFYKRSLNVFQILIGLNGLFGVFMVLSSGFSYQTGFLVALVGAVFAAIVTIISSTVSKSINPFVGAFYQASGILALSLVFIPFYTYYFPDQSFTVPTSLDWVLLLTLSLVLSVVANAGLLKIVRVISPFSITLVNNLTPIYGIIAALIIFGKEEAMTLYFYSGTIIILASVIVQPALDWIYMVFKSKGNVQNDR
jgi:drug/metabolite transporter (DMT)-like permease